jgi:hypothetical protein
MLEFLSGWPGRDPGRLGASPEDFVGHPAYGIAQLRDDLDRFALSRQEHLPGGRQGAW